jgi:hypothetical protein
VYGRAGFKDGDSVPGIVGYEADRMESNYPLPNAVAGTYTLLSHSPFTDYGTTTADYANSSVYQAPSGAWVFAAGTFAWSWALDNFGGRNLVDARIQQTTMNILNRFEGNQQSPSATTHPASNVGLTTATLNGSVNPNGGDTHYSFEYGTTPSYGSTTPSVDVGSGTNPVAASANIAGLAPSTTYHFQLVATSSSGTTNGGDLTFTTAPHHQRRR